MTVDTVRKIVEAELAREETFENLHGITRKNVSSFLVEPFLVSVDPDDLESGPREMWVVAQEQANPARGYVVVYDPAERGWGVAEQHGASRYTLVVGADSLASAFEGM